MSILRFSTPRLYELDPPGNLFPGDVTSYFFSLTLHDKRVIEGDEKLKPILKKSTEDLVESIRFPSILKTRDDFGYMKENLLKSKPDHVRIQSPSFDCSENIRIRSPSPDFDESTDANGEAEGQEEARSNSPEVFSILKNRLRFFTIVFKLFILQVQESQR